jgi:hypothetical protein
MTPSFRSRAIIIRRRAPRMICLALCRLEPDAVLRPSGVSGRADYEEDR